MLSIVSRLKESIFNEPGFLEKLVHNREFAIDHFQTLQDGRNSYKYLDAEVGQNYESIFLDFLSEEVHRKLPDYRMFVSVDMTINDQPEMREPDGLGMQLDYLRSTMCNPHDRNLSEERDSCFWKIEEGERFPSFHSSKCFEGRKWKTEVDAVIAGDSGNLCFIEYEEKLSASVCNNFMKMHRLRIGAQSRQIESLFILRLSKWKHESPMDRFDSYMTRASGLLDTLLGKNWNVLVLINLLRGAPKLKWYPEIV